MTDKLEAFTILVTGNRKLEHKPCMVYMTGTGIDYRGTRFPLVDWW